MRLPAHYYAFASLSIHDPDIWFANECWSLAAAKRDRADLKRRGCPVGPIVRVPIPKLKSKRKSGETT
jgi:hypothetical protein